VIFERNEKIENLKVRKEIEGKKKKDRIS